MPTAAVILAGLRSIANQWLALAIVWHALVGALIARLIAGWRPSNRLLGRLMIGPLVSVSVLAWASGNPFNGAVFSALALVLVRISAGLSASPVKMSAMAAFIPGLLLMAFAWVYPHFLDTRQWATYTYAAPLGLIPCPTLSAILGMTLLSRFFRSRSWSLTLAAAGVFYGVVGVFVLGVMIDVVLLMGALTLALEATGGAARSSMTTRAEIPPA
jgi:hypothetical protein